MPVDNVHNLAYNKNGMKEFRFNDEKNERLKIERGIGFEVVIEIIKNNKKLKAIEHPNRKKYPKQKIFLVKITNKIYAVPFIEESEYYFLKTIYPSQKYTKKLLKVK